MPWAACTVPRHRRKDPRLELGRRTPPCGQPFGLLKVDGTGTNPAMEAASSPLIAPIPTGPGQRGSSGRSGAPRVLPDPGCDRFTRVAATMFRVPWALLATVEPDGFVVRSLAGPAGVEV